MGIPARTTPPSPFSWRRGNTYRPAAMGHDSPSLDTASICDLDQHAKDHGA